MEFQGQYAQDTIEVLGPDADGEYRVSINELKDSYVYLYLTRATLVEMHAFIGELLGAEEGA
jgi:hypothetical protein